MRTVIMESLQLDNASQIASYADFQCIFRLEKRNLLTTIIGQDYPKDSSQQLFPL